MRPIEIDWYFDFISPYSYLQSVQLARLPDGMCINRRPILFAALLKHFGQLGPAEIPAKRRFTYRQIWWLARRHNIAFRMPRAHPFNPLPALRLSIAKDNAATTVATIFHAIWVDGLLPDDPGDLAIIAARAGVADPQAALSDPTIKQALRANTEQAIERGVFGVPTLMHAGQLFWGFDSLEFMLDAMADPTLLADPEIARMDAAPIAAQRARGG